MQQSAQQIVKELKKHFTIQGLTLAVAESCTGGLITHLLTNIPGASEFVDSGLVTYSNESKERLLNVRKEIITLHGAVSAEAARSMATGIKEVRGTDFAISSTGNLGPASLEGKPVGLIYFCVACPQKIIILKEQFTGTRLQIKKQAAVSGLSFLLRETRRS